MKSAKTMTFFGVVVHSFSGSLMMRSTSSRGIFECSSAIQIAAASAGSDLIELHRIVERGEEGLDHQGVLVVVARRRPDDVEAVRAAQHLVAVEHLVDARVLELVILKGRRAEMRIDLGLAVHHRGLRIRMAHRDGQGVERIGLAFAEHLLGRHLQE